MNTAWEVCLGVGEKSCPLEFLEVPENSRFQFLVNTVWGRKRRKKARKIGSHPLGLRGGGLGGCITGVNQGGAIEFHLQLH